MWGKDPIPRTWRILALFSGDTETLKKSPGTAERMASLSPIKSNLATVAKIYQDLREAPKTHPYCKRVADMSHKNA